MLAVSDTAFSYSESVFRCWRRGWHCVRPESSEVSLTQHVRSTDVKACAVLAVDTWPTSSALYRTLALTSLYMRYYDTDDRLNYTLLVSTFYPAIFPGAVATKALSKWGHIEVWRPENWGTEGVTCREGVSTFLLGKASREAAVPPSPELLNFSSQNSKFWRILRR